MSVAQANIVLRRMGSGVVDLAIELGGGLLGSYFGMMVAALLIAVKNEPAEQLQASMWNGLGFGFIFWALSVSFMNRVLIQGVSRASIGKKLFKIEIMSTAQPLTWTTMMKRWVLSTVSLALGGLGYIYLLFDREHRTFHDLISHTDVIPLFQSGIMSMEHKEEVSVHHAPAFGYGVTELSKILVLSSTHSERPMATVIRLPLRKNDSKVAASLVEEQLDVEKKVA